MGVGSLLARSRRVRPHLLGLLGASFPLLSCLTRSSLSAFSRADVNLSRRTQAGAFFSMSGLLLALVLAVSETSVFFRNEAVQKARGGAAEHKNLRQSTFSHACFLPRLS